MSPRRGRAGSSDTLPDGAVTLGVIAQPWRAHVLPDATVVPPSGAPLRWVVVAEDRVHDPASAPTRRQRCVDGGPVVETSVRVPGGDVVVTAYAVADRGGAVVLEVENRAGTSVAFACSRADVLAARPLAPPPSGGPVDPTWRILPLGHGAGLRVALPATTPLETADLLALPDAAAVGRGWQLQLAGGLHVDLPDPTVDDRLRASRAAAVLAAPQEAGADPEAFLLGLGARAALRQLAEGDDDLVVDVAAAAMTLARAQRRAAATPWRTAAALVAAADVLHALGDERAAADARDLARRVPSAAPAPDEAPADALGFEAWLSRRLAASDGTTVDLLPVFPVAWRGANLSAYQVPTLAGPVGFAVRWHGARPALLWEAPLGVVVRCSGLDPAWTSTEPRGEALLAAPTG